MTYFATYPTVIHGFFMSFLFIHGFYQLFSGSLMMGLIQCVVGALLFFSFFIRYNICINDSGLSYWVNFLGFEILKENIETSHIKKMNFKRVGWNSRGAYIYTKKSFSIRLVNFQPPEMYEELIHFAQKNKIQITIKDDFKIINSGMTKDS